LKLAHRCNVKRVIKKLKSKKRKAYRIIIYIMGMLLLAFGITLNTRTNLGVSPIISVAFCVSKLTNVNIGNMTLIWYIVLVVVEILCHIKMKKYKSIITDVLQIPLSIVFTRFMNLFTVIIPDMTGNILGRLAALAIAIVLTGMGIVLTLNVRLLPNPGDGIVQALADLFKAKISTVKNILDAVCVVATIVIGFIFAGKIIGIGIGTILAVIFVGRVVAVGNYFLKEKIIRDSGLER